MAYLRSIEHKCDGCSGRATRELINWRNCPSGKYCARCARRELARLTQLENESVIRGNAAKLR